MIGWKLFDDSSLVRGQLGGFKECFNSHKLIAYRLFNQPFPERTFGCYEETLTSTLLWFF